MAMQTCDCGVEYSDMLFRECPRCKHGFEPPQSKQKRRTSGEVALAKREKAQTTRVRRK